MDIEDDVLDEASKEVEEGEHAKMPLTRSLEHFRAAFQDIPRLGNC